MAGFVTGHRNLLSWATRTVFALENWKDDTFFFFFVMPGHDQCCDYSCTNRRNKCPGLSFRVFPKTEPLRSQWIVAIKRGERDFQVTSSTVVCGEHFLPSDYYVPLVKVDVRKKLVKSEAWCCSFTVYFSSEGRGTSFSNGSSSSRSFTRRRQ